eukprot:35185_1
MSASQQKSTDIPVPTVNQLVKKSKPQLIKLGKNYGLRLTTAYGKRNMAEMIINKIKLVNEKKNKRKPNENNAQQHVHKFVQLVCEIESHTLKKRTTRIKLPSKINWNQNVQSILSRIPIKFPIISDINDDQWCLMLDDDKTIIEKHDSSTFGEVLSTIKPPAILKIIYNTHNNILIIEFNNKSLNWIPTHSNSTIPSIWNTNYDKLLKNISIKFLLNSSDYELQDEDECDIECGEDLMSIWQALEEDDEANMAKISVIIRERNTSVDENEQANNIIDNMSQNTLTDLQIILQNDELKEQSQIKSEFSKTVKQPVNNLADASPINPTITIEYWKKDQTTTYISLEDAKNMSFNQFQNMIVEEFYTEIEENSLSDLVISNVRNDGTHRNISSDTDYDYFKTHFLTTYYRPSVSTGIYGSYLYKPKSCRIRVDFIPYIPYPLHEFNAKPDIPYPLHKFSTDDVCDTLKHWVTNDTHFKSNISEIEN